MVYIKKMVTVLYLSIFNVFWLLNLGGVGGDASFAPQANLVIHYAILAEAVTDEIVCKTDVKHAHALAIIL